MFGSTFVAGVSVVEDGAQIVVLKVSPRSITVRFLAEVAARNGDSHWFLAPLLARERRIVRKVSRVSIALDPSRLTLHSFPLDRSLDATQRTEHVDWELGNFLPSYRGSDYLHELHLLKDLPEQGIANALVIAAERSMVRSIRQSLAERKFDFLFADAYFFGAQYALLVNYPETTAGTVALAAIAGARVDFGTLHEGRLVDHRFAIGSSDDALAFLKIWMNESHDAGQVYFCGPGATPVFLARARELFGLPATLLNPFASLRTKVPDFEQFVGREHVFASAVGVALRKE